jgi:hypothetical protein
MFRDNVYTQMNIITQNIHLRDPTNYLDILRLPWQGIPFPLPYDFLRKLGERLYERIALLRWECFSSNWRPETEYYNTILCSIHELFEVL